MLDDFGWRRCVCGALLVWTLEGGAVVKWHDPATHVTQTSHAPHTHSERVEDAPATRIEIKTSAATPDQLPFRLIKSSTG
jgi:hypothetical protein